MTPAATNREFRGAGRVVCGRITSLRLVRAAPIEAEADIHVFFTETASVMLVIQTVRGLLTNSCTCGVGLRWACDGRQRNVVAPRVVGLKTYLSIKVF